MSLTATAQRRNGAEEHAHHDGSAQTQNIETGRSGNGDGRSAAWACAADRARRGVLLRKRARSHPLSTGRLGLPVVAHCRRRTELADFGPVLTFKFILVVHILVTLQRY